jgi:phospho-N-acetylmuramoyl-pentapeptide-transferase
MILYFFKNNISFQGYMLLLILALATSFITTFFAIKQILRYFSKLKIYQPISQYLSHHQSIKSNVPTMGGLAITLSIFINLIVFNDITNTNVQIILLTLVLFGIIGILDDLKKIKQKHNIGQQANQKLVLQIISALLICFAIHYLIDIDMKQAFYTLPFTQFSLKIPPFVYYITSTFIICGSSNAVNLTDGLDGLATSLLAITFGALIIICILPLTPIIAFLFDKHYIHNAQDLGLICITVMGSLLAFLWYNSNPASIFMGDCGSLTLGALMGVISILIKRELICGLINIFFIIETLSVIMQVIYFKFTNGKRMFLMAPLHHHFEKIGVPESKITVRSTIFSFIISTIIIFIFISTYNI